MRKLKLLLVLCMVALAASASKTVYLVPGPWNVDGARYALYMFTGSEAGVWADFTDTDDDGTFSAEFNDNYASMIICRMNGGTTENNWDNKWNQTANLAAPVVDGMTYTMTSMEGAFTLSGNTVYLYNVGADKYLCSGNNWGSHASVGEGGIPVTLVVGDGSYKISTASIYEGRYLGGEWMDSGSSTDWTFELVSDGVYKIKEGANVLYWNSGTLVSDGADPTTEASQWKVFTEAERIAAMANVTASSPMNVTFLIKNYYFAKGNGSYLTFNKQANGNSSVNTLSKSTSWKGTFYQNFWGADGGNSEANYCIEEYQTTFELYQELKGIPNGKYFMTAKGFYRGNVVPYIYANDQKCNLKVKGDDISNLATAATAFLGDNYKLNGVTVLVTDGTLRIGVKSDTQVDWSAFDDFSLTYLGIDLSDLVDAYTAKKAEATALLEETMSASYKTALQAAITANASVDETSQTALETAVQALTEAIATANISVNSYKVLAAGKLPDNSLEGWTCTNTQAFHINTWSTEGNSDGTGMVTPFIENWRNAEGFLDNSEIYYTLNGLDPGIYKFSALIRAYSESGNNPAGASLFAGDREIAFATGNSFEFVSGKNTLKGIYDNYAMTAEVGDDGVFRFGVKIDNANFNWMAFKNCKVEYVGAAITEQSVEDLYAGMPTGKMNKDVRSAVETAYAAAKANVGLDTYEALDKAIVAAKASADAYAAAKTNLDKVKAEIDAELASTNVYTQASYDAVITNNYTKYNAEELTDAEANDLANGVSGTSVTGWQNAILIDNILLSAWDTNPDFNNAPYYINSWSTEGNNDGTNFKVPFFEYYANANAALGEKTMTATVNGLEPGRYKVTAWVRVATMENLGTAEGYGITLQLNDGDAVDVCKGNQVVTGVNSNQRIHGNFTAVGTVGEDGVLKIKFNVAADNNIHWLSFKNVKYETATFATDEEKIALANAITAAEGKTLGFEAGEYAPYNNSAAILALNVAKNLDAETAAGDDVVAATEAIADDKWKVNTEEVNAIYDGSFNLTTKQMTFKNGNNNQTEYVPVGWNNLGYNTRVYNDASKNAGLNATSQGAALFAKFTTEYGTEAGYTMPLKAGDYMLEFIYGGWNEVATRDIKIYCGETQATVNPVTVTAKDKNAHTTADSWSSYKGLVTIPADGDYVLSFYRQSTTSQNQICVSDIVLKKAPVYAVVGNASFFSDEWDQATTADMLTLTDGVFTKIYADVELDKQTIEYKFIKKATADAETADVWYDNNTDANLTINIPVKGRYDITFTFDETTVAGVAAKTAEAVVIGEKGWATTVTNSPLNFAGATVEAYTATVDDNTVTLTKVTDDVQAETGLVLKGTAGTYYLPVVESSSTDKGSLMFSSTETYNTWQPEDGTVNTFYGLTVNANNKAQFVKLSEGTIPAQKAFLMINTPAGQQAHELAVVFEGEATGINSMAAESVAEGVYNLNGQRVAAPAKGLYIVNGKKVVKK